METKFAFGEYVDYKGQVHKFVVAGVVNKVSGYVDACNGIYDPDVYPDVDMEKSISVGISICNPEDKYNENIGKLQAEGRAKKPRKNPRVVYASWGIITPYVVELLIKSIADDIKANPGKYVPGYNESEKKWIKNGNSVL